LFEKLNLGRSGLLPLTDLPEQFNKRPIPFPSLRREAMQDVSEIGLIKRSTVVDIPRQESLPSREFSSIGLSTLFPGFRFLLVTAIVLIIFYQSEITSHPLSSIFPSQSWWRSLQ
jgi:hypothetical protein